ncbi:MAG: hypothetical protein AB8G22_03595 [Saprospiraceae bacterium]
MTSSFGSGATIVRFEYNKAFNGVSPSVQHDFRENSNNSGGIYQVIPRYNSNTDQCGPITYNIGSNDAPWLSMYANNFIDAGVCLVLDDDNDDSKRMSATLTKLLEVKINQGANYNALTETNEDYVYFNYESTKAAFPSLINKSKNGNVGTKTTRFVPIIIQAMQEQQQIIDAQADELAEKTTEITDLQTRLAQLESIVHQLANGETPTTTISLSSARLEQNQPNPFSAATTIKFHIPERIQHAELRIVALNGQVLKTVTIAERGAGQINLASRSLAAGSYTYTLVLDGEIVDTKQMVLTVND